MDSGPNVGDLLPGDCLLYTPSSLFGAIIKLKTWHSIAHVEVFAGAATSWASRDGKGVSRYPWRNTELAYILRPCVHLDLPAANAWATSIIGTPYGWLELLNFVGLSVEKKGMFCSQFVAEYYRHAGWHLFPEDRAAQVAPFEFLDLVDLGFAIIPLPK